MYDVLDRSWTMLNLKHFLRPTPLGSTVISHKPPNLIHQTRRFRTPIESSGVLFVDTLILNRSRRKRVGGHRVCRNYATSRSIVVCKVRNNVGGTMVDVKTRVVAT